MKNLTTRVQHMVGIFLITGTTSCNAPQREMLSQPSIESCGLDIVKLSEGMFVLKKRKKFNLSNIPQRLNYRKMCRFVYYNLDDDSVDIKITRIPIIPTKNPLKHCKYEDNLDRIDFEYQINNYDSILGYRALFENIGKAQQCDFEQFFGLDSIELSSEFDKKVYLSMKNRVDRIDYYIAMGIPGINGGPGHILPVFDVFEGKKTLHCLMFTGSAIIPAGEEENEHKVSDSDKITECIANL